MKVWVKQFDLDMEIKARGIELAVYSSDGKKHKGYLVVKKNKLIWCRVKQKLQMVFQ